MMDRKEDDLLKNQTLERKALPKRIRQEMKAREQMFRASMRISVTNLNEVMNPTEEKDRLKKVGGEARKHLMMRTELILLIVCSKFYFKSFFFSSSVQQMSSIVDMTPNTTFEGKFWTLY